MFYATAGNYSSSAKGYGTSRKTKFYWEKTADEIAKDDKWSRLSEAAHPSEVNATKSHLKSFTFFRLPLFDHPNSRALLSKIKMARGTFFEEEEQAKLDVEAAVFHDTLLVLAEAVKMLNFHAFLGATDVSCSEEKSWESGATFYNYINAVETNGITGNIRFKVEYLC